MLSEGDSIRIRILLMSALLLPVAGLLAARLYYVQIVRHDELLEKAREKYTMHRTTIGRRGEIYDVRGNLLVGNTPCINLVADPAGYDSEVRRRRAAMFLAEELQLDLLESYSKLLGRRKAKNPDFTLKRDENGKILRVPDRNAMIARNLSLERGAELKNKVGEQYIYGLFFLEGYSRSYPKGRMLANVLGFTQLANDRDEPVIGVEKACNRFLVPREGEELYERARDGRPLTYGKKFRRASQDGWGVVLTVDERMQSILEEELDAAYLKWKPKGIYAVMAEPRTGNILAIAQRPTFDPEDRKHVESEAWRVRLLEDGIEPGSIMKPFTVARGLDLGAITPDTRFDCEKGVWSYLGKLLRDSHGGGVVSVSTIIQTSSNIGTAKIALALGPAEVESGLRSFGFAERTGLPLRPETRGIFPRSRAQWNGIGLTRYPIGYGILVSPVQMVRAYCALANGGTLRPLRLVDRLIDPDTGEERALPFGPSRRVLRRPDTAAKITDMLASVTRKGGTATAAAIPGYSVAGKTGTSRKVVNKVYDPSKHFASFIGYVPARDPAFVLMVTMDEPTGGTYGGTVAGPVFRQVGERCLRVLNVPPTEEILKKP